MDFTKIFRSKVNIKKVAKKILAIGVWIIIGLLILNLVFPMPWLTNTSLI